jgi:hypothetical protein
LRTRLFSLDCENGRLGVFFVETPDSGGDVSVVVASVKEVKVGAVRQAFQDVFGRATVTGMVCIDAFSFHSYNL